MLRFELKTEYRGHEDDVRAIRVNPEKNTEFATVSRDKTLRIWTKDGDSTQSKIFTGHSSFVSCLYWAREGEIPHLKGSIVISGSRDCRLIVWNIEGECIHYELLGHTLDVTSVCVLRNGDIVSGSQDSNICVWRNGNLIKTLIGHESSVLTLVAQETYEFLSGGADGTIRKWGKNFDCLQIIRAHDDTVRCLCLNMYGGFCSSSHDTTIKLWSDEGILQETFVGHRSLIYCIRFNMTQNSEVFIASASEDNTVKIWNKTGICIQTIVHEKCVWAVEFIQDEVFTACADNIVRCFTPKIAYSGVMRKSPTVESEESCRKDYIFEIDVNEGSPTIKLVFKRGQNPVEVAEKWLKANSVPLSYKEKIVEFLINNVRHEDLCFDKNENDATVNLETPNISMMLPRKEYLLFEKANFEGILKKLREFNFDLGEKEIDKFSELHFTCCSETLCGQYLELLTEIFRFKITKDRCFPVFDLIRVIILEPKSALEIYSRHGAELQQLLFTALEAPASTQNLLTGFRILCNSFKTRVFRENIVLTKLEQIFCYIRGINSSHKKAALLLTITSFLFNVSVFVVESEATEVDSKVSHESFCATLIHITKIVPLEEEDCHFRVIMAIGNFTYDSNERKKVAQSFGLKALLQNLYDGSKSKVRDVSQKVSKNL